MKTNAQKSKKSLIEEKREKLKQKIKERADYVRKGIMESIEKWPEEYKEKGREELARLNKLEEKLLNIVDNLDESTISALFELCYGNTTFDKRKEIITFLHGLNNDEILEIAGVIYPCSSSPFSDPFFAIYKRYFQWRRYGPIWKRKRREILKKKKRCEICGSKKDLEVHHLRGLGYESPEDLIVLCKNCHKQLHKLADALKQELTLTDVIKDLEKEGMIKAFDVRGISRDDIEIYYLQKAYYLMKEEKSKKRKNPKENYCLEQNYLY